MYLDHFNLKEPPFGLTPNTEYFYKLPSHHAAYNMVMMHLKQGEGFLKVVGDVGTGKTLLCRLILDNLDNHFVTAYIPNPDLDSLTLRKCIAMELGVSDVYINDQHKLLAGIHQKLMQYYAENKRVVLFIDEAQALSDASLETLRLFTNFETKSAKLMQIVLFGQPELDVKLNQKSLRQLKQRISFSHRLSYLKYSELDSYVYHRLRVAGHQGRKTILTLPARWYLHSKAQGVPRLVNILCHKAMMSAFGRRKKWVTLRDMKCAARDTESVGLWNVPIIMGFVLLLIMMFAILHWHLWK